MAMEVVMMELSTEDLFSLGFSTQDIDERTMRIIAEKLENHFLENGFWEKLEAIATEMDIPREENNGS